MKQSSKSTSKINLDVPFGHHEQNKLSKEKYQ